MDRKTILKIFGEAFLRSMVVLMAIAIVGFGAFFLIKVNSDKKQQANNPTTEQGSTYSSSELEAMLELENANDTEVTTEATTEEVTTEEPTTEEPDIPSTDKNILVLNGTRVSGLASKWKNKLSNGGFSSVAIGNSNLAGEEQTKIYVAEEGMGKDLSEYFSDAEIIVGTLNQGDYQITSGSMTQIDIFIVVGSNDTTVQ